MMLGMCPTLAVTTLQRTVSAWALRRSVILTAPTDDSLLRKIIPDGVRMPAYIVVVASFVTIVEFLMEGFIPALYSALGIYIPLIVELHHPGTCRGICWKTWSDPVFI